MINITHPTACTCDRCKMNSIQGTTSGGVQLTGQFIPTYGYLENENENLKSLLRELDKMILESDTGDMFDTRSHKAAWLKRIREAVGDGK